MGVCMCVVPPLAQGPRGGPIRSLAQGAASGHGRVGTRPPPARMAPVALALGAARLFLNEERLLERCVAAALVALAGPLALADPDAVPAAAAAAAAAGVLPDRRGRDQQPCGVAGAPRLGRGRHLRPGTAEGPPSTAWSAVRGAEADDPLAGRGAGGRPGVPEEPPRGMAMRTMTSWTALAMRALCTTRGRTALEVMALCTMPSWAALTMVSLTIARCGTALACIEAARAGGALWGTSLTGLLART